MAATFDGVEPGPLLHQAWDDLAPMQYVSLILSSEHVPIVNIFSPSTLVNEVCKWASEKLVHSACF